MNRLLRSCISLGIITIVGACQSTGGVKDIVASQEYRHLHDLNPLDLTFEDENVVTDHWKLTVEAAPKMEDRLVDNSISGCVTIVVGIDAKGQVYGSNVKYEFPANTYGNVVKTAIKRWQWQTGPKNPNAEPALITMEFLFDFPDNPDEEGFEAFCL